MGRIVPYIVENKTCLKPPATTQLFFSIFFLKKTSKLQVQEVEAVEGVRLPAARPMRSHQTWLAEQNFRNSAFKGENHLQTGWNIMEYLDNG